MSGNVIWRSDVVDWEKVSVESYRFVIEQAKEKLDDLISESIAITSWSMKILFAYVAGLSGITGFIFSDESNFGHSIFSIVIVIVVALISIYVFTLLLSLVAVNNKYSRGSQPKDIFRADGFKSVNPENGLKNLLLNETERLQFKLERINSENNKRQNQFKFVLRLSLMLIALVVFALVKKMFSVTQ